MKGSIKAQTEVALHAAKPIHSWINKPQTVKRFILKGCLALWASTMEVEVYGGDE